jgi:hypothetical protein
LRTLLRKAWETRRSSWSSPSKERTPKTVTAALSARALLATIAIAQDKTNESQNLTCMHSSPGTILLQGAAKQRFLPLRYGFRCVFLGPSKRTLGRASGEHDARRDD